MNPILSQLWAIMSLQEMGVIALKVLASLGGAGIGLFVTGWGVRGLYRLIAGKSAPGWLLWSRWLGAAAAGAAVWTWAFGLGGGFGFGSGPGSGQGGDALLNAEQKENLVKNPTEEVKPAELLRVHIVRSRDYVRESKRYYIVEGETEPKTLADLLDLIKQKKEQSPDSKTVEVFIFPDSVSELESQVGDLKERLRALGLTVNTTHKMERAGP
jgi:hypothetical protein